MRQGCDDPAHNQINEHSRIHTNAHERSETDNQIDNSSSLIIVTVELRTTIIILFVTLTLVTMMVRSLDGAALSTYHTFVDSGVGPISRLEVWFHRIGTLPHLHPSTQPRHRLPTIRNSKLQRNIHRHRQTVLSKMLGFGTP